MSSAPWIRCQHTIPAVTEEVQGFYGKYTQTIRPSKACRKEAAFIETTDGAFGTKNERPVCGEHPVLICTLRAPTPADVARWGKP